MTKYLILLTLCLSFSTFSQPLKRSLSKNSAPPVMVKFPNRFEVLTLSKAKKSFDLTFINPSDTTLKIRPRFSPWKDEKLKKYFFKKDQIKLEQEVIELKPGQKKTIKALANPEELSSVLAFYVFPDLVEMKNRKNRRYINANAAFVVNNFAKGKHSIDIKSKIKLKKGNLRVSQKLKNDGDLIFYNYRLHHILLDSNNTVIYKTMRDNPFKSIGSNIEVSKKNVYKVGELKKGTYKLVTLFKDPLVKDVFKNMESFEVK
ncbi:MAG: hypothetical protein GY909_15745 [Oligoflexia bacterium]|nr:hypothetical protein [Oligoflexia bacterium]